MARRVSVNDERLTVVPPPPPERPRKRMKVTIYLREHNAYSPVTHFVDYPSKVSYDSKVLNIHLGDDETASYPLDVLWCWTVGNDKD